MQVAKYWRNNQLRYRLQGVVQQKVQLSSDKKSVEVTNSKLSQVEITSTKVKVA